MFFRKCSLEDLVVTVSVQNMLWSNYNPFTTSPAAGVLVAGYAEAKLYSTVAVRSEKAFDLLSPENRNSLIHQYLHSHQHDVRVIPWMHYPFKQYAADFHQFCEQYVVKPFLGMIVLKPTSQERKRHFEIKMISGQEEYSLPAISPAKVPFRAQENISLLLQYWITASRFEEKNLRII